MIVVVTKFTTGAWIAIAAMLLFFVTMRAVKRHYTRVAVEIAGEDSELVLPSRIHAIVLVSKLHLPTLRALGYARATRPDTIEAVTVNVDPTETSALAREWEDREIPVPLKVIDSPYREITRPVLDYVRRARKDSPRDVCHRLHSRICRGSLVGAVAAQPIGAAVEGPVTRSRPVSWSPPCPGSCPRPRRSTNASARGPTAMSP